MLGQTILTFTLAVMFGTYSGDTRLPEAAMKGDQSTVQSLLKQKVDVNEAQADGNTALHWAAYRDDVEMARLLIQAGANPNLKTRLGDVAPLHLAATNGDAAVVELLVKAGADVNAANGNGTTPLMFAAASGRTDAIRILLDQGANVNARDTSHGQTALMFAAALNRAPAIKLLVKRGADVRLMSEVAEVKPNRSEQQANVAADARQHNGNPFTSATFSEKPADKSANPPASKPEAPQPKPVANAQGAPQGRGRDVTQIGGHTALHFAARDGQMEAVKALVEAGADVNQLSATTAMTPLIQAIITGHFDIAKYFLDHGADPNLATKKDGLTPLYATIDSRFAPRVDYPAPSVDQENTTYLDLMKQLLAMGAKVDARLVAKPWFRFGRTGGPDPEGSTAFWRAAQANDLAAMKLLAAAGANPYIGTVHGSSPLQAA